VLDNLLTEQRNAASSAIDSKSTSEIVRIIHADDLGVAAAITPELERIAAIVDGVVARLRNGGRLFYIGAGTSGRLGVLDAAECRPTFQVPDSLVQGIIAGGESALARATEASEDDPDSGVRDLLARGFGGGDVLIGIAASGRTPYVLGAVRTAREMGAFTAGICCTPDSLLAASVDVAVTLLTGAEIITGSTRMKAGTATKLVLNMISTATMIRLGFVYGNLMVNVQPTNEKLAARARRIVSQACGIGQEEAGVALNEARGNVRVAILMSKLRLARAAAEERLNSAGGRLSEALAMGTNG
jgi:N-acetylmuramic acid 6-phosphate etherase